MVLSNLFALAQDEKYKTNHFLKLATGIDKISLRDEGTSPLIYTGVVSSFFLGYHNIKPSKRNFSVEAQYAFGKIRNKLGVESSESSNHTVWLRAEQMYNLNKGTKWHWYAGGAMDFTTNVRVNPKLMNNQLGLDFVQSIFVTAALKVPLKSSHGIDFFFFKIKKKSAREKYINLQAYVPLWFSTYRNGYAYANQSGVINGVQIVDGYEFKIWNGLRFRSRLGYVKELKSRNRYELNYQWEAYKTYGAFNQLTVSHHALQFSLWYNLH